MPNPWEEYSQASPPPPKANTNVPESEEATGSAPWEEYQATKDSVVQEMHPELSTIDRLVIKNFASSPEAGVDYLRMKHPDLEVKQIKGQTVVRKKDEPYWRVLDPDTGILSAGLGENLRDVGDLAYDALSGVGVGAATTAGATLGNIPGAAMAGGAASAGAEALRQKIGAMAGIPQEINPTDVMVAGGFGAALPVAGAGIKGVYGAVTRKIVPEVAERLSGVPKEVYKDYAKSPEVLQAFEADPPKFTDLVLSTRDKLLETVDSKRKAAGDLLEKGYDKLREEGKLVDISGAKKIYSDMLSKAEDLMSRQPTEALQKEIDALREVRNKYLSRRVEQVGEDGTRQVVYEELPDLIDPKVAWKTKQHLSAVADAATEAASVGEEPVKRGAMNLAGGAASEIDKAVKSISPEIGRLNSKYTEMANAHKAFIREFGGPSEQKTLNTMRNLDKKSKEMLRSDLTKLLNPEEKAALEQSLQTVQTQSYLANPSSMPLSAGGTTSTSRTIPAEGVGRSLGALLFNKLSGGSYAATKAGAEGGGALGAVGFAPRSIRRSIDAMHSLEKKVPGRPALYGTGLSAWEALRQRQD